MSGLGGGAGVGGHAGHGAILPLPDPNLVHHVIAELKSHGIFDQFRKECIADVDTKPAYQNLRQRVESAVAAFLNLQTWSADLNKNQLRDKLRKHILDSNFLDQGVERIVDQVVNPRISSVFIPQVEEIVYKCLGLEKPEKPVTHEGDPAGSQLQPDDNLLPNDLESVSPESVKSNENITSKAIKRESKKRTLSLDGALSMDESDVAEEKVEVKRDINSDDSDNSNEEEFESPAFEPLETAIKEEGNSKDSHLSGISDLTSHESNNSAERKADPEVKPELHSGDSQLSQVSSGSNLFADTAASDVKSEKLKTNFQNSFGDVKCEDSNSYSLPMVVDESANPSYKFNDDNASDARQYFEENNPTKKELNIFNSKKGDETMKDNGNGEIGAVSRALQQSADSKISADDSKVYYMEMAIDSNDANSVFIDASKRGDGTEKIKEECSFENKISSLVEKQTELSGDNAVNVESEERKINNGPEESSSTIKSNDEAVKETDEKKSKSNGKDNEKYSSRRNSRDRKDDSRHHSKSSHSRHDSRGRHSERRHSSSRDKRDSRNSESKNKDKHGRQSSNNGDSKKDGDKDRHGSSSYRSSHKSSRDSKHLSEKSSSEKYSTSRQNSKDSDKNKESSKSSRSNGKDRHSHSESKHHERTSDESKSYHSSHKDKSSSKHASKSSKSNSTDEKKNDDKKRKSSKDEYCSSSVKNIKPRRSTDRDSNDGNSGFPKGPSSNSSNASSVQCNQKAKSSPCADSNSIGNCSSGQSDSTQVDMVNIIAGNYIKSEFNMFQFGSMGAIKRHSLSEKSPLAKFPEMSPPPRFPEKSPSAKFPEMSPPPRFPDKSPVAKFPDASPSSKGKSFISNSPIETKPGEKTPPPQNRSSKIKLEKISLNKFPEYSDMPSKKPVIHIDGQLKPSKIDENSICKTNLLGGIKKPKCASNIYEAMKFMKIRKQIKKIEERKKREAILLMEKQKNLPSNFSSAFSGIPGPELELACMNAEFEYPENRNSNDDVNYDLGENLKYFDDKYNRRLTNKIDRLQKYILKIEKGFNNKLVMKTNYKNGYKNSVDNKIASVRPNKLSNKMKKQPTHDIIATRKPDEVQISSNIECNDKHRKTVEFENEINAADEMEYFDIDPSIQQKSQEDIMGIILGDGENFESAVVYYKQSSEPIELSFTIKENKDTAQKTLDDSPRQLKRKRTSLSSSSNDRGEESENFIHNNNLEENNKVRCKRILRKSPSYSQTNKKVNDVFPGSPESDKSVENHIGENKKNPPLNKSKNPKTGTQQLNYWNRVLRTNAKIGDSGNKGKG